MSDELGSGSSRGQDSVKAVNDRAIRALFDLSGSVTGVKACVNRDIPVDTGRYGPCKNSYNISQSECVDVIQVIRASIMD